MVGVNGSFILIQVLVYMECVVKSCFEVVDYWIVYVEVIDGNVFNFDGKIVVYYCKIGNYY